MKKSNLEKLVVLVKHFVSKHTTVFAGVTGNDHQLIKNHLYFHLHQYIKKCLVLQLVGILNCVKDTEKGVFPFQVDQKTTNFHSCACPAFWYSLYNH